MASSVVTVHRTLFYKRIGGLGNELGIALDGLECPRQDNERHSWNESTHVIVIDHTQPSHSLPDDRMYGLEGAQVLIVMLAKQL